MQGAEDTGSDEFLTSSLPGSLQLAAALLETMVTVGCSDQGCGHVDWVSVGMLACKTGSEQAYFPLGKVQT